jgi:Tol biopolymer transport system component
MNRVISQKNIFAFLGMTALVLLSISPAAAQRYSEWSEPENLGPVINTSALEGCPFISKDNLSLFFASNRPGGSGLTDLHVSTRAGQKSAWRLPVNLGAIVNSSSAEVCPTLTISGNYLYFVSNRPGGCGGDDIYVSRRQKGRNGDGWGTPVNLGCQFNSPQNDVTPSLFTDEDGTTYLYFSSNRPGGPGMMDIYVSLQGANGVFGPPSLVEGLNTEFNDQRPNVRMRDGLEIFFESDRPGTLGLTDLYSSTRETVFSAWTPPENLGAIVNGPAAEGRPSLSWDGTQLYFMSTRAGGFGSNDIYVVERRKLRGTEDRDADR